MDATTASLERIQSGKDFVAFEGLPIFDEHDEFDKDGNLVRHFGRSELQEIVDRCNKRLADTGDLSPVGPGHTIDNAPETSQPPIWGYAGNFRLDRFGPQKRLGITADFYMQKTIQTPNEGTLTAKEALGSFPRRSVELWIKDKFIDWIALLRRTPQRDLGVLSYSRGDLLPVRFSRQYHDHDCTRPAMAVITESGKLRYGMEDFKVDPTQQPNTNDPDPAKYADFMKCMKKYEAEKAAATPAAPAVPAPAHVAPAPAHFAKEPEANGKPEVNDEVAKYQRQNEAMERRCAALEKKLGDQDVAIQLQRYQRELEALKVDGFEMDVDAELEDIAERQLTPEKFAKHVERIKKHYRQGPADNALLRTRQPESKKDINPDSEDYEKALQYARKNPGTSWTEIWRGVKESS